MTTMMAGQRPDGVRHNGPRLAGASPQTSMLTADYMHHTPRLVEAAIVDRHKKHQEPKPVLQEVDSTPIPVATTSSIAVPGPLAGATSLTDSPTHTHPATTSSQGDTVETLSSVPTSAEPNDVQPQASSYFGKNGAWVVAHTNPESSS